ncbi:FtsW/RodA/SpoVE family cell cycle protein [Microbacterium sp. NPDC055903]
MTQVARPKRTETTGLAARVSLGRIFTPVSTEFLLIASSALLLTVFGLVMIISATSATEAGTMDTAIKQAMFVAVGLPMMFLVSRMPLTWLKRLAWPALIGATLLQLLVFTPLGVSSYGNQNWIVIAGFQLQPSEFLKLALSLWIAYVLLRKKTLLANWKHVFIPVIPVSLLVIGAVMAGDDLGTAMVLVLVLLACLFFSGVKLRLFIIPLILGAGGVLFYALSSENRMRRITALCANVDPAVNTESYINECYQSIHGMWGMATGGVFGLGLGNSQEKYGWLPAASNDFIFAIVGEELGLIGCIVVLALFVTFAVGAFHVIRKTDDPFIRVAAGGITVWIIGQALINIGVVIGIFPVMGVPLPFMSQGGTALLSVLLACGVLLAFARTLPAAERGKVAR